ncbi:hypothetical protein [Fluviicola taffensis]|uniref:hypothetical protein n=1 Tax=Fluviicola taffensis TaxID=191579 RepID=UPI00313834B7
MYKNVTNFAAGFMVILCLIFSYYLLFTDVFIDKVSGFKRQAFGILFLLYGIYRAFRLYYLIKKNKSEEN